MKPTLKNVIHALTTDIPTEAANLIRHLQDGITVVAPNGLVIANILEPLNLFSDLPVLRIMLESKINAEKMCILRTLILHDDIADKVSDSGFVSAFISFVKRNTVNDDHEQAALSITPKGLTKTVTGNKSSGCVKVFHGKTLIWEGIKEDGVFVSNTSHVYLTPFQVLLFTKTL